MIVTHRFFETRGTCIDVLQFLSSAPRSVLAAARWAFWGVRARLSHWWCACRNKSDLWARPTCWEREKGHGRYRAPVTAAWWQLSPP